MDTKTYTDNEILQGVEWPVSTLTVFVEAILRYLELLEPYYSDTNIQIKNEMHAMSNLSAAIRIKTEHKRNNDDLKELVLKGGDYGTLHDIMWKYKSWKDQVLKERERVTTVAAALEGDRKELENILEILRAPVWNRVTRHKILVDSFYTSDDLPKSKDPAIQQQITIGAVYGQFAGINNGQMTQNNNQDVMTALNELTKIVAKAKGIDDENKQNVLGDLQTIQAQASKKKPNRVVLEGAFGGLQVLANISQIASLVAPHMDKVWQFIQNLPMPQ